jgi:hypothetical protein
MNANTEQTPSLNTICTTVQDPRITRKNVNNEYIILNYKQADAPIVATEQDQDQSSSSDPRPDYVEMPEKYYSVVLKTDTNVPLSVAPYQPIQLSDFIAKYPVCTPDIVVSRNTEGTLVQLFYDHAKNAWEISTKSSVGANHWHYRTEYSVGSFADQKTFRQMFYDALILLKHMDASDYECVATDYSKSEYEKPLSELPFISGLPKEYSYNFILAHPANPIVNIVYWPHLTLISVYKLTELHEDTYAVTYIDKDIFAEFIPKEYRRFIYVQGTYDCVGKSMEEVVSTYQFLDKCIPGLMFTNVRTGERTLLENPEYSHYRQLRGNHSNMQYQFYELFTNGKLSEFVSCFPLYNALFTEFYNQYLEYSMCVYSAYFQFYILKKRDQHIDNAFHRYAKKIHHDVYLAKKNTPDKFVITQQIVDEYLSKISPSQLMYNVNTSPIPMNAKSQNNIALS